MDLVMTKTNHAFAIEDFHLWYGDHLALKNVNLTIPENEVTAIIGPSGCGKSTFLKSLNLMCNMIPHVKMTGKLMYDGQNLVTDRTDLVDLRRKIGMVFQKGNPFPQSIYDNIAYGPRIHGIKKKAELNQIVEDKLKDVGLWEEVHDRLSAPALGLSGGQQQRLCIARALATNPEVLLMDEPTSALDPISTLTIEELILQLKEKYTVVIVTHNMQQAGRVSDLTAFFLMGELIEFDRTEKIFSQPADNRTEDYISGRFG